MPAWKGCSALLLWAVLFSVLCRGQDGNYGIGVPNSLRPVLEVKPTAVSAPPIPQSTSTLSTFQKAYNAHEVSKTFGGFTETYYHQLLDLVCLRYPVTQLERSSEACGKAWTNPKVLPPVGVCDLGKGGPFDKEVIGGLVEEVWEKVEERTAVTDGHAATLRKAKEERYCLPPPMSLITATTAIYDNDQLANVYGTLFSLNEDIQTHIKDYIEKNITAAYNTSVAEYAHRNVTELLIAHTKLYDCGIVPSVSLIGVRNVKLEYPAFIARNFIALLGEQFRDNNIVWKAEDLGVPEVRTIQRRALATQAKLVRKNAPLDPNLLLDTRNFVDPNIPATDPPYDNYRPLYQSRVNGELSVLAEEAAFEGALSIAGDRGSFKIQSSRNRRDSRLQPAVGIAGQISLDPNIYGPSSGVRSVYAGDPNLVPSSNVERFDPAPVSFNILGDISYAYRATQDLTPEFDDRGFLKATGSPLRARALTDKQTGNSSARLDVLFNSAGITMTYNLTDLPMDSIPVEFDPRDFFIVDILGGRALSSKSEPSADGKTGTVYASVGFGNGIEACGWGGGGAYAVGFKAMGSAGRMGVKLGLVGVMVVGAVGLLL